MQFTWPGGRHSYKTALKPQHADEARENWAITEGRSDELSTLLSETFQLLLLGTFYRVDCKGYQQGYHKGSFFVGVRNLRI